MRRIASNVITIATIVFGSLVFAGCIARPLQPAPDSLIDPPFLPPTQIPTPVPPTPTPIDQSQNSSGAGCTNDLKYISDVSVPDGSEFKPGEKIDKKWEVENSGTCSWDKRYKLKQTAGNEMGVSRDQALYPARAGSRAEIRIQFIAPAEPGLYSSKWQAYSPSGIPFGEWISIQIVVK
jgi:hypothetical protein